MTTLNEKEVWKDIPGYEGRYQASTEGRIRSVARKITQIGRWGKPFTRRLKGQILSPGQYCKSGHMSVVLGHGAPGSPVHQLILKTFAGPTPEGQEVRHKNGNPKDNRLKNLVYGTRTDNILDVYRLGRAWRKLTTADVREIRKNLALGKPGSALAKEYGVSDTIISKIKTRRCYKWLP